MDSPLYIIIVATLFVVAVPVVRSYNERSAKRISALLPQLNLPQGTMGYMSGQSIFSKKYVFLADSLIFVSASRPRRTTSIKYENIDIKLRGWLFPRFNITDTSRSGIKMRVMPLNRVFLGDDEAGTGGVPHSAKSPVTGIYKDVVVAGDTASRSPRSVFDSFTSALLKKGVPRDRIKQINWKRANLRWILACTLLSILLIAGVVLFVLVRYDSKSS